MLVNDMIRPLLRLLDREELRRQATLLGTPMKALDGVPKYSIKSVVRNAWDGFFHPSEADLDVMEKFIRLVIDHYAARYSSSDAYIQSVQWKNSKIENCEVEPICLTGMPGVGKSSLAKAIARLIPRQEYFDIGSGYKVNIDGCWYMAISGHERATEVCQQMVSHIPYKVAAAGLSNKVQQVARFAHRDFVGGVIVDEMQAMSTSSGASTELAKTITNISRLGIPFIFVANYSACWKLLSRSREQVDRTMLHQFELYPFVSGSPDWLSYLDAGSMRFGHSLKVDLKGENELLFWMTAGIKRYLRILIERAYETAWGKGRCWVLIDDLREVADGPDFATVRAKVDESITTLTSGSSDKINKHDRSPFPLPKVVSKAFTQAQEEIHTSRFNAGRINESVAVPSTVASVRRASKSTAVKNIANTPNRPMKRKMSLEEHEKAEQARKAQKKLH